MDRKLPNILLLVLESVPASHVTTYGYQQETTPNLDRFAEDAVLYEKAISPAAWTLPSHASLFTGLYITQHGTHYGNPFLSNQLVTMAEMLQARGYETAAFATNPWVTEKTGFNRGFKTFRWAKRTLEWLDPLFSGETPVEKVIRYARDPIYPIDYRNNKLLQGFIEKSRRQGRPFFAYTQYFNPHYPYRPQWPYIRKFLKGARKPWWRVNIDPDRYMAGGCEMDEEDFRILNALYDSRLAAMDAIIGRFLEYLRRTEVLDETLLFIVADHGENLGEHNLMSHQYCLYDSLVHVPLIARYPRLFPAGRRVADVVQPIEIFTTIMDVVDIDRSEIPNDVRGRSLVPDKLAGNPLPYAISEYAVPNLARMRRVYGQYDTSRYDRSLRAIRRDGYKGIFASDGQHELYDVDNDPGETQNLAADRPELLQELQGDLEEWLVSVTGGQAAGVQAGADGAALDEAVIKRLQDLGYF